LEGAKQCSLLIVFFFGDANLVMEVATIFPGVYHYHFDQSMLKDIV